MSSIATLICSDRIQDSNGQTALFNVAMKGNLVDCQLFNEHGADINTKADERTPLYGAVEFGHHDVALWFFHHPNYDRKWDNNLFTLLCGQSAQLIAPYLDLFAVGLYRNEPHTPDFPNRIQFSSSRHYGFTTSVYYLQLAAIYGDPCVPVPQTALALAIKAPNRRELLGCRVLRSQVVRVWQNDVPSRGRGLLLVGPHILRLHHVRPSARVEWL